MSRRAVTLQVPTLVALVTAVLGGLALAPAPALAADDTQIVVYNKGKTLRYDPDVGAELKEVFLETFDCKTGKLSKKETIEAYFHLSEDKEIITPEAICDDCRTKFTIEKKNDKYFFNGVREKAATIEEANAAAPAPTKGEAVRNVKSKVEKIAKEIVKIDANKKGSPQARARIINAEFTTSLQNFSDQELNEVAGFVTDDASLSANEKYYVLRSFGFTFYAKGDFPKSVFFYDKCIELIPENYSAYNQKAAALSKAGSHDKAYAAFAHALVLKPNDSITREWLAAIERGRSTEKLSEDKVASLKSKVESVDAALKSKAKDKALEEARAIETQLTEWFGGASSAGSPPPPSPPDSPSGEPPSTPPPGDDSGLPPPG